MKTTVYIDLDGVMVDLYRALKEQFDFEFPHDRSQENRVVVDALWDMIAEDHPAFWRDLSPTPYKDLLFAKILELDPHPYVLSATPQPYEEYRHQKCALQKTEWVCDHLTPELRYRTIITKSKLKQNYIVCDPRADRKILVDDHPGNIARWIAAGGIAVHHTDINRTLKELEALKHDRN